jgi:alpha-galactosidase
MMQAPLLTGCDIRSMSKDTKDILGNQNVIAVNQG